VSRTRRALTPAAASRLALAAVCACALVAAAPARAAGDGGVVVCVVDGSGCSTTDSISGATLLANTDVGPTSLFGGSPNGVSLQKLLTLLTLPIAPRSVSSAEVVSPSGTSAALDHNQVADPTDPENAGIAPELAIDATPGASPTKAANADEYFLSAGSAAPVQTSGGAQFTLYLTTRGTLIAVTLSASSTTSVAAGGSVGFTASATGPGGEPLSFSWTFGDGARAGPSSDATQTHVFPQVRGTYPVVVTVSAPDGSAGVSRPLIVTVGGGSPAASGTPGPGTGTTPQPGALSSGPQTSGGNLGGAAPGPSHQAATHQRPASKQAKAVAKHAAAAKPRVAKPSAATPAGAATVKRTSPAPPLAAAGAHPLPRHALTPLAGAHLVTGQLIGDTPLAGGAAALLATFAPPSAPPERRGGGKASIAGILAGGAALLVIFCMGAERELGLRRRRLRPAELG
jgi:hypothetical protein